MIEQGVTIGLEEVGRVGSIEENGQGHAVPRLGKFVVFVRDPSVDDDDWRKWGTAGLGQ